MEYGAIDLHKNESQIRIVTASGEVIDRRIRRRAIDSTARLLGTPATPDLVEASTESEWVAQHLETLGHEVIVADPNYGRCTGIAADASKPIAVMWRRSPRRVSHGIYRWRIAGQRASGWCSGI